MNFAVPKPLLFSDPAIRSRFAQWKHKIIYKELEGQAPNIKQTWDIEDYQRNALFLQGVLGITSPSQQASEGDILIVADVDEIIRPEALLLLRECHVPPRVTLKSRFFYYGFDLMHVGEQWGHPQATIFKGKGGTILPADLRNGEQDGGKRLWPWQYRQKADLWDAGWHCSSCFDTVGEVLGKMSSFSHTGLNQERWRDPKGIVERVRKGRDLWDREGEVYKRVQPGGEGSVPGILREKEGRERFGYLLDRTGWNAGFRDFDGVEGKDGGKVDLLDDTP